MQNLQTVSRTPHNVQLSIVPRPQATQQPLSVDVKKCPKVSTFVGSRRQIMSLVSAGLTIAEIAHEIGCCERTVRRVLKKPEISAELKRRFYAEMEQLQRFTMSSAMKAARVLEKIYSDEKTPVFAKVAACKEILKLNRQQSKLFRKQKPITNAFASDQMAEDMLKD
jgi:predicted transcriptional regulator